MVRSASQDLHFERYPDVCTRQYCSVQEFSAPDGQVFLPYWLMQNLRVPEGDWVVVTSVVNLPRGIYCRFQPESTSFLDLAAEIGPKLLMETALRRYSVLSMGSTIVIAYGTVRYHVQVAELKPAPVVSLCGDVDLETDFMPPEGSDPIRPSTAKSSTSSERIWDNLPDPVDTTASPKDAPTCVTGYGRRLRDGGYVENVSTVSAEEPPRRIPLSLQKAQKLVRDRNAPIRVVAAASGLSLLAVQLRSAQRAFSTPGYTLGMGTQSHYLRGSVDTTTVLSDTSGGKQVANSRASTSVHTCKLCLAEVSSLNMELHTLRCAKNPTYHKFQCTICNEKILCAQESKHRHCPDCFDLFDSDKTLQDHQRDEHITSCKCTLCHAFFTRIELQKHLDNRQCDHALIPCSLCGLAFKKKDIAHHSHACSSRTERCDECMTYVKITDFDTHRQHCGVLETRQEVALLSSKLSNQNSVECVYCLQDTFPDVAAVEYHVLHTCRIAKSFTTFKHTRTNQDPDVPVLEVADSDAIVQPLLAQGRMRRKGDTSALRSSPLTRLRCTPPSNNDRRTPPPSPTFLLPTRMAQQGNKLRTPKSKARLNPQLRSLPQQVIKVVALDRTGLPVADLCISSVRGTSHRALAAPPRLQATTRVRRRPATKLPPSARLDKLP
ncbi:Ubiquitin fusion degradation protein UFD1 [Phytophthora infestans]|uniref:Ubiquitin fusion degradation protein UFD1 n=1 Tax=Phytophthora infestans TaxID=4787 RepID=A0A833W5R3_PHYIN|nr:Ubiquitin fusion degradation protein UFD1 [Phytophthora infestans]